MRVVLQRVKHASVQVDGAVIGEDLTQALVYILEDYVFGI